MSAGTEARPGRHSPIVVVGAGPTGIAAATFLGMRGVEVLVLDRWPHVFPQPRAVHLDDEVHRLIGLMGVADRFAAVSRPGLGLRMVTPDLRVVAEFDRSTTGRHGYVAATMFDQPDLEALLRDNLAAIPSVSFRGDLEVTAIRDRGAGGVEVDCMDTATGSTETIHAAFVLGCDGANSTVRAQIGSCMRDLRFDQRWLVIDVRTDLDLEQWDGVHQVCEPHRSGSYMRIGEDRYRWEFRLGDEELAEEFGQPDKLLPLLRPWTGQVAADHIELVRVAEYTFRAQVADRWRRGNVFLLGDAAHLTPPFIGQGMGAGLRDAANLSWKLAGVLAGTLPDWTLDTYQAERAPHVTALIKLARTMGVLMTSGHPAATAGRALLGHVLLRIPAIERFVTDSSTPPLRRGPLVLRPRWRGGIVGTLAPNSVLETGARYDEVVGIGPAVVSLDRPDSHVVDALWSSGITVLVVDDNEALGRWLRRSRARAALVRPDRTVLAAAPSWQTVCALAHHVAEPSSVSMSQTATRGEGSHP